MFERQLSKIRQVHWFTHLFIYFNSSNNNCGYEQKKQWKIAYRSLFLQAGNLFWSACISIKSTANSILFTIWTFALWTRWQKEDEPKSLCGIACALLQSCLGARAVGVAVARHLATSQSVMASPVSGRGQGWVKSRLGAKPLGSSGRHDKRLDWRLGARILDVSGRILCPAVPLAHSLVLELNHRESAAFRRHAGTSCRDSPALPSPR